MRVFFKHSLLAALAALLAGCAVPTAEIRDAAGLQRQVRKLQQNQEEMVRSLERLQDNLVLVEARLHDQQVKLDGLQGGASPQKVTPSGEKAGVPVLPPSAEPSLYPNAENAPADLFRQAFGEFASGRYHQAISGFEEFLRLYPGHEQAGNALFWLGECYYARQQYAKSAETFGESAELSPQGGKAPEALLKMATALKQARQDRRAGEILQLLRERYPESAAARKSLENE